MKIHHLHSWDVSIPQAIALQHKLAAQVDTRTPLASWNLIAGADISYNQHSPIFYAVVVVLRASDWTLVEKQEAVRESSFPYVPGLLSFREGPALLEALARIESPVDAVMFDGQGIAHPRRLGIASHLGLWLEVPTLGCAKSRLTGKYQEPGLQRAR
jgi:deoxyribonuclease V